MGIFSLRAERFVRPAAAPRPGRARSGGGRKALPALALALALLASGATASEDEIAGRWTISLAPSVFAPRMNGLNNALASDGINVIQAGVSILGLTREVTGFKPIQWGFGGQLEMHYQINDDIRGGLRFGAVDVRTSDRLPVVQVTSFSGSCTGCPKPPDQTDFYEVSEKMNLPLFTLGVSLQKVFLFEEEPNLSLYLGGSGVYTTMLGASLRGEVKHLLFNPSTPDDTSGYAAYLTGQGWGFGGAAGGEYVLASGLSIFLESGFDLLRIPNVQASLRIGPVSSINGVSLGGVTSPRTTFGRLKTLTGQPIEFDFSGVFIRLGVRFNLTAPR